MSSATTPAITPEGAAASSPLPASSGGTLNGRGVTKEASAAPTPSPNNPIIPSHGVVGAAATQSTLPETQSGEFHARDRGRTFTHTVNTDWGGRRYALTLNIPFKDDKYDRAAAQEAAEEFATFLIKDLKDQLDRSDIKPGQDVTIRFNEDSYEAFVIPENEKTSFDQTSTAKIPDSYQKIIGNTETAKKLCELVTKIKDPGDFQQGLTTAYFKTLKNTTHQSKHTSTSSIQPVGLVNHGNECFFNAAFEQWATNPLIRQELLNHPDYFIYKDNNKTINEKCGANHPLYIHLKGYDEHRRAGKTDPYDFKKLPEELKIEADRQDDVDVALRTFENQLDFTQIKPESALYSETQHSFSVQGDPKWYPKHGPGTSAMASRYIHLEADESLAERMSAAVESEAGDTETYKGDESPLAKDKTITRHKEQFKTPPDVLTVGVHRTVYDKTKCSEEQKKLFIDALFKHEFTEEFLEQLFDNDEETIKQFNGDEALTDEEQVAMADAIMFDSAKVALVRQVLTQEELNLLLEIPVTKDDKALKVDSLEVTLPEKVCGKETTYDLMSYSYHSGTPSGGHWVAYVRDLKGFWKISDHQVTPIEKQEFLANAGKGSFFILNKKERTPTAEENGSTGTKSPDVPVVKKNRSGTPEIIKDNKGQETRTSLIPEEGTLAGVEPDYALVNPTNYILGKIHSDLNSVEPNLNIHISDAKTAKINKRLWKSSTIEYSDGHRRFLPDSLPDVEETPAKSGQHGSIFHVVLPGSFFVEKPSSLGQKDYDATIKNAVTAALQTAIEKLSKKVKKGEGIKIAFPLFSVPGYQPNRILDLMKEAVREFARKNATREPPITAVKIILPSNEPVSSSTVPPLTPEIPVTSTKPTELSSSSIQIGKHTTFSFDVSGTEPSHQNITMTSPDKQTFIQELQDGFGHLSSEKNTAEFDLTAEDTAQELTDKIRYSFNISSYNLDYLEAVDIFKKELSSFAETNKIPGIQIQLKVPKGVGFEQSDISSFAPTDVASHTDLSIEEAEEEIPSSTTLSTQKVFLNELLSEQASLQTIKKTSSTPSITVISTDRWPANFDVQSMSFEKDLPLSSIDPNERMQKIQSSASTDTFKEIIIDCRPGANDADDSGVVALDYRHCNGNLQRLRNFIGHVIVNSKPPKTKPITIILPLGLEKLPSTPQDVIEVSNLSSLVWRKPISLHRFFAQAPKT